MAIEPSSGRPPSPTADAIFDRRAVRLHRDRAAATVGRVADVLKDAAERLVERLDDVTVGFGQALDVGGRGAVAPLLRSRGVAVVSCDLSPRMAALNGRTVVAADEAALPFAAGSFDLVVACLSLHWVDDLVGALVQLRMALRPGGLLLASLPVLGTLGGLRTALAEAEVSVSGGASPRVSPFPDLRDLAGLMQRAGFELPVADVEEMVLSYADPTLLMRELRDAGEANAVAARSRRWGPRALLPMAAAGLTAAGFRAAGSADGGGRVQAVLRLGTMTGWAPRIRS